MVESEQQEMEKAKQKYHKSYSDWQEAIQVGDKKRLPINKLLQNYERADADGTLSRNEILKMKIVTDMKSRTHGDCKSKYDSF